MKRRARRAKREMEIVITEWALDAYLDLKAQQAFTAEEYRSEIRPDVRRLKVYPNDPKFGVAKFWSPAQDVGRDGYKLKWHNMGPGTVQLRCPVGLLGQPREAFLCGAYVKTNPTAEKRALARFRTHLELIRRGCHTERGRFR